MDLRSLQIEVGEWSQRNFGQQPAIYLLSGIIEEIGEVNHAWLKKQQKIREGDALLADAIGDTTIYLLDFATRLGILLPKSDQPLEDVTTPLPLALAGGRLVETYLQLIERSKELLGAIESFAIASGLDLEVCIASTWEAVSKRDWVRFPKNGVTE